MTIDLRYFIPPFVFFAAYPLIHLLCWLWGVEVPGYPGLVIHVTCGSFVAVISAVLAFDCDPIEFRIGRRE